MVEVGAQRMGSQLGIHPEQRVAQRKREASHRPVHRDMPRVMNPFECLRERVVDAVRHRLR